MKTILPNGMIRQTMHAVFDGEKQLTAWRTSKQATFSALRRGTWKKRDGLTIETRAFFTPHRAGTEVVSAA